MQDRVELIHLQTLDEYRNTGRVFGVIDFCKIDVEGHELEVLRGMVDSLKAKTVRIIQFEYGGTNIDSRVLLKDIFAFFDTFGYQLWKIKPNGLEPVEQYTQSLENFQYQNWIAAAPGVPL